MPRHNRLNILPGLAVLMLLFAAPTTAVGGVPAGAWADDVSPHVAIAKGGLRDDAPRCTSNPRSDQDDTPDPISRPKLAIAWLQVLAPAAAPLTRDAIGPTHRACAAHPRAPPAV
jgi:hypothetical protein